MAGTDTNSSWERIRQGVKEAETLIGQKKYNLSMVKSRQTLEFMVQILCEKAAMIESDLASSIDELYSGRYISKTTCEHYHKIRMLGNKAVHEGSENAYDANQAYHLLSQEVYTFANDYNARRRRPSGSKPQGRSSQSRSQGKPQNSSQSGQAVRRSSNAASSSNKSRKRAKQSSFPFCQADLIRLGAGLVIVILLIFIIRACGSKPEEIPETSPNNTVPTIEQQQPEPSTAAPTAPTETMAETTPAPVYKTSTNLNVRSMPSTEGTKLGLLPADTIVEYLGAYDDSWAIISYDGEEAYVASQYLVHD